MNATIETTTPETPTPTTPPTPAPSISQQIVHSRLVQTMLALLVLMLLIWAGGAAYFAGQEAAFDRADEAVAARELAAGAQAVAERRAHYENELATLQALEVQVTPTMDGQRTTLQQTLAARMQFEAATGQRAVLVYQTGMYDIAGALVGVQYLVEADPALYPAGWAGAFVDVEDARAAAAAFVAAQAEPAAFTVVDLTP